MSCSAGKASSSMYRWSSKSCSPNWRRSGHTRRLIGWRHQRYHSLLSPAVSNKKTQVSHYSHSSAGRTIVDKMGSTATETQTTITADNVLRLFPDVNTSLASTHRAPTTDSDLQGYDEEQIRLMEEVCIVLDNDDNPIGSASKKVCRYL